MTYSLRSNATSSAMSGLRPMKSCLMTGCDRLAVGPEHAVVDGHVAPAEERLPLVANDLLEQRLAGGAAARVGGQEDDADAVVSRVRQLDARGRARRPPPGTCAGSASGCRRRRRCSSRSHRRPGAAGSAAPEWRPGRSSRTCDPSDRRRSRRRTLRVRARGHTILDATGRDGLSCPLFPANAAKRLTVARCRSRTSSPRHRGFRFARPAQSSRRRTSSRTAR